MSSGLIERFKTGEILIADGATATNYQAMGLGLGVPPEEWVLDAPQNVLALHRAFVDAGSNIILTDSFGGTRLRMRDSKYADRAPEINRRAAELARQAAGGSPNVLVAGSMGPTGMLMEPLGELTQADAANAFAEQAAALAAGGVDFLLLETFFGLDEAQAAITGVQRASALPLIVSFSFDRGTRTMMGTRPEDVVRAIAPLGVGAIGANCGKTLDAMEQIVAEMTALNTGLPLWIKPNAGLPKGIPPAYETSPEEMADYAVRYVRAGARVVGGCCGTTPAHVRAIAHAVKSERGFPHPI